jgi:hypothetical protein
MQFSRDAATSGAVSTTRLAEERGYPPAIVTVRVDPMTGRLAASPGRVRSTGSTEIRD